MSEHLPPSPPPATPHMAAPPAAAPVDEIGAMRRICTTLEKLDERARDRIVTYLYDRYVHVPERIASPQ